MSEYHIPERAMKLYEDIQPNQLKYHQHRVAVTKEFTFDAAHHLYMYEGKCKSLHGHTYRLVITVSGYLDERGLCIDFGDLKEIYKLRVERPLDHHYLNEVLPPMNTTAENIVSWIWRELESELKKRDSKQQDWRLEELILYETPTSRASLKREWMTK
ncbi:6-carboxytetrahydropterin synthase QueD [Alicyclobacillus sp. SO9]|uniref:6-carboxytetrahydropterin synthase QueD n=1 Tax=Alicyclobacillus sp. SO9 TaxID=2665646 RepID=UPI0018E714F6|nr:6-carboxytetrahydropterin synthase QueD [Alicyclobacillus sp. SO9]QQE80357.1 6-carboxytetrahydropterin synthase QueD [Alicyclobacillus sp. SO9]